MWSKRTIEERKLYFRRNEKDANPSLLRTLVLHSEKKRRGGVLKSNVALARKSKSLILIKESKDHQRLTPNLYQWGPDGIPMLLKRAPLSVKL